MHSRMDSAIDSSNGVKPSWPVKTREMQNHHSDTTLWNDFEFRDDDIVISTWGKSGTTWMQQVISQLIHQGDANASPANESHWLDFRSMPGASLFNEQGHRRYIKTHSPIDTVVYDPKVKYVFVARDGRDSMWSMHNHMYTATQFYYDTVNDTPGRVGPPLQRPPANPVQFFREFLDDDADMRKIHCPFWDHFRGWWGARGLPNLLLVHFDDLKANLEGEIRRVARFLEIDIPGEKWADVVRHCEFSFMKENSARLTPEYAGMIWKDNAMINKGSNRRWKDLLTQEDNERYEAKAVSELGEEGARWLAKGDKVSSTRA